MDRSTTLGEVANLITSRYNNFDSAASVCSETGVGDSDSESEPSLSDAREATRGGVGSLDAGSGSGGRASTSRNRSCPLR